MITPPIFRSFVFSLAIHIFLFIAAFLIIEHSRTHKKIQPYIVSLVEDMKHSVSSPSNSIIDHSAKTTAPPINQLVSPSPQKTEKSNMHEENIVKERIAALQAKKKIEKMVALRKIVDIEGKRGATDGGSQNLKDKIASTGTASTSASSDYYATIVKKIRQEWVFPENLDRNLEAIVSIQIAKNGSIRIDKIEKSSGNPVFDRYALRAINKASPLPPPPHEMVVGVRFYP